MNSLELTDKKNILQQRLSDMVNNAEKEYRKFSEGELKEFDSMVKEIEQID